MLCYASIDFAKIQPKDFTKINFGNLVLLAE